MFRFYLVITTQTKKRDGFRQLSLQDVDVRIPKTAASNVRFETLPFVLDHVALVRLKLETPRFRGDRLVALCEGSLPGRATAVVDWQDRRELRQFPFQQPLQGLGADLFEPDTLLPLRVVHFEELLRQTLRHRTLADFLSATIHENKGLRSWVDSLAKTQTISKSFLCELLKLCGNQRTTA